MRTTIAAGLFLVAAFVAAQDNPEAPKRYGFPLNIERFPQSRPQEALQSIIKATQENKVDYMLAHLAEPGWVDKRVVENAQLFQGKEDAKRVLAFDLLVKQTSEHFRDDPTLLRELKKISDEGEWNIEKDQGIARFALLPGRAVYMKEITGRWFLENKQK